MNNKIRLYKKKEKEKRLVIVNLIISQVLNFALRHN
jgi:hypothetical protein